MKMKLLLESWKNYVNEKYEVKDKTPEQIISELEQLSNSPFIFFDTETLGLNPRNDQITQLAYLIDFNNKKEEKEMIAHLTKQSEERFNPGTEENKRYVAYFDKEIQKQKDTAERMLKAGKLTNDAYQERIQKLDNKANNERDPSFVLKLTHYNRDEATISEEDMLKTFLDDITNKYPNPILVAHNARFDEQAINIRNEIYGLPKITGEKDLGTILDTLSLCRDHYVPQLQKFVDELDSQINQLSHNPDGGVQEENEDLESLKNRIAAAGKDLEPEKKRLFMLQTLKDAAIRTLQNKDLKQADRFSSKLGDIAKTFNIDPEGAHRAINDVRMLANIYKEMLKILILINRFMKNKELVVNEINI